MADELTFQSSRARGLFVFSLSWCFVALGFWLVSEGERLFGWLSAGFFVLGNPVGLITMIAIIYAPHYNWRVRYSKQK